MGYKIGSFNMYKFQVYANNEEIKKDIPKIASIIHNSGLQIVALQEIFSKAAMDYLLNALNNMTGGKWEGRHEIPLSSSSNAAEGYAFIWRKDIFQLARTQLPDGRLRISEPSIFKQYRLSKKEGQKELVRNPYYARFHPISGPFCELRLINCHIMFSRRKTHDDGSDETISDIAMRKNEFSVLATALYPKLSDRVYGNNRPGYTILLGDYNLNLKRSNTHSPYLNEVFEISDGRIEKTILTVQDELTTLRHSQDNETESIWANNYDHFTYDSNRFDDVKMISSRFNSVNYCSDYTDHLKCISDHVPVQMDIDFRNGR